MSIEKVRSFVHKERSKLCDGRDTIDDAIELRPGSGTDVAVGLLVLGEAEEAIEWFAAVSTEWVDSGTRTFTAKYIEGDDNHVYKQPWKQYQRSLQTGVLGRIDTSDLAEIGIDKASREFIDDLDGRELTPRIDLVRALGEFLVTSECNVTELRERIEETAGHHKAEFNRAYYLPQATTIEAIAEGDADTVEEAIGDLLEFHEEFIIGAPDANIVDEAVAFDTCAYLALARQHGLDVAVDSDYVPDALTDDEYYPVDEA